MSQDVSEFSLVSESEERLWIVDAFVLCPMTIVGTFFLITALRNELKDINTNEYKRKAINWATLSLLGSILIYLLVMFVCNDFIIPWNYKQNHSQLSTVNDIMIQTIYFLSKVSFYYSITYHIQSLLYESQNRYTSSFLSIWMVIFGVLVLVFGFMYSYGDASQYSAKETGITQTKHVYLAMYLSHEGANLATIAVFLLIVIDFIYFVVLIYFYISKFKNVNDSDTPNNAIFNDGGIKGVLLITFCCIIFWIDCTSIALHWQSRWIFSLLDTLSDDVCLYFVLVINSNALYHSIFALFHSCFGRIIYGAHYKYDKRMYEMVSRQDEVGTEDI